MDVLSVLFIISVISGHPDWVLAGIFADDGISGTNTKKRDEFNRMIDECDISAENHINVGEASLSAVFNALSAVKDYLDILNNKLTYMDTDQEIIDTAGLYLNCPMFYFDKSYRVLAITRHVPFDEDEEWGHMLRNGFLSPENALKMKENGDLDKLAAADKPVIYTADFYRFSSIVTNILYNDHFVSRLNILCIRGDTSPVVLRACEVLAEHLKKNMIRSHKAPVGEPVPSMLMDLLRGVSLSETLIDDRTRRIPSWRSGLFCVFCIDVGMQHDEQVGPYYAQILNSLGLKDALIPLIFDNKLVVVVHAVDQDALAVYTQKLSDFYYKQHLYGGVSNYFNRLSAVRIYYGQALVAMEMGQIKQINFYRDYMLRHIVSYIPDERTEFLISPDIELLTTADTMHSLSLTETLKEYLACNCSLLHTAEKIYVHKNTLLYRLKKIKSIIKCNLEDADERMLLSLSFKLLEKNRSDQKIE